MRWLLPLLWLLSTPVWAQTGPIRHERLPAKGQTAPRTDRPLAGPPGQEPIDTAQGQLPAPQPGKPGDQTPIVQPKAPPWMGLDRRTGADGQLHYQVVFEPSIAPYKREYVFDRVAADLTPEQSGLGEVEVPLTPQGTQAGHELFWGHVRLTMAAGERAVLPSVAPTSRILRWQTTPQANLRVFRDDAGNVAVTAQTAVDADVRFMVDAPATYFGAPVANAGRRDDPPVAALDPELQARARALWTPLRVARSQSRKIQVERLTEWFRAFTPGEMPAAGRDPLADLVLAQKGVCRHRARGFFVLALSLGIPTHLVVNEAHAFVEVWVPLAVGEPEGTGGWQRIDLGGGAESLELHAATAKHLHQPQWRDPFPQPPAFAAQSGGDGQTWAGAAQLKGADFNGAASSPGRDKQGSEVRTTAGLSEAEQRQRWLAERAQRVAAPPRPPMPGPARADGRRVTRVTLRSDAGSAWVGEPLRFSGTFSADGGRVARQAIELWMIDPRQPTQGRLLAQAGTDAQGHFVLAAAVPAEVDLRDYDFVARFAGDAALRPTDSSW